MSTESTQAPQGQDVQVTQGDTVGSVGFAGNGVAQRPHVHFEVRSGNNVWAATSARIRIFTTCQK